MPFALAPSTLRRGYRLEAHDTVGSTNALALRRAAEGDPGKLWIAALAQEEGRGRRGRAWASPHGNLAATLLVALPDPHLAATLGFVAGLSLAEALAALAPMTQARVALDGASGAADARFTLKWPNDVLADGAKLAGILLESAPHPGGWSVAVGIGVNVVGFPAGLPYPATSLHALGADCGAAALFAALAERWAANAEAWDEGRGLERIRRRWLDHAAGLGAEAALRLDGEVVRGVFETIDEDCRFVLRLSDGTVRRITAGDVHFGVVASASAA